MGATDSCMYMSVVSKGSSWLEPDGKCADMSFVSCGESGKRCSTVKRVERDPMRRLGVSCLVQTTSLSIKQDSSIGALTKSVK